MDAYIQQEIVSDAPDFMCRAFPIAIHGDAVPCTKRMSLDTTSWSSCMTHMQMPTVDAKWLITGVLNRCAGPSTKAALWNHVIALLAPLLMGVFPMKDGAGADSPEAAYAGLPLCGCFLFVVWMIRADMDYLANYLDLENFNSLFMCP